MFFLAVPVRHPPLVRWSVMSQYGYVGAVPRLAEGSNTQSMGPPLNLPQVP